MSLVHIATRCDPASKALFLAGMKALQPNGGGSVDKYDQIRLVDQRVSPAVERACQSPSVVALSLADETQPLVRRAFGGERRVCRHPEEIVDVQMLNVKPIRERPAKGCYACTGGSSDVNAGATGHFRLIAFRHQD
jgi:hypothetical protein